MNFSYYEDGVKKKKKKVQKLMWAVSIKTCSKEGLAANNKSEYISFNWHGELWRYINQEMFA